MAAAVRATGAAVAVVAGGAADAVGIAAALDAAAGLVVCIAAVADVAAAGDLTVVGYIEATAASAAGILVADAAAAVCAGLFTGSCRGRRSHGRRSVCRSALTMDIFHISSLHAFRLLFRLFPCHRHDHRHPSP